MMTWHSPKRRSATCRTAATHFPLSYFCPVRAGNLRFCSCALTAAPSLGPAALCPLDTCQHEQAQASCRLFRCWLSRIPACSCAPVSTRRAPVSSTLLQATCVYCAQPAPLITTAKHILMFFQLCASLGWSTTSCYRKQLLCVLCRLSCGCWCGPAAVGGPKPLSSGQKPPSVCSRCLPWKTALLPLPRCCAAWSTACLPTRFVAYVHVAKNSFCCSSACKRDHNTLCGVA